MPRDSDLIVVGFVLLDNLTARGHGELSDWAQRSEYSRTVISEASTCWFSRGFLFCRSSPDKQFRAVPTDIGAGVFHAIAGVAIFPGSEFVAVADETVVESLCVNAAFRDRVPALKTVPDAGDHVNVSG